MVTIIEVIDIKEMHPMQVRKIVSNAMLEMITACDVVVSRGVTDEQQKTIEDCMENLSNTMCDILGLERIEEVLNKDA